MHDRRTGAKPRATAVATMLLAGLVQTFAPGVAAAKTPVPVRPSGAPPRRLNIVRVKLKPRSAAPYGALETQIVRAFGRANVRLYWIGLQSPTDPSDVLYLNLFDSDEGLDLATEVYRQAAKKHPDLVEMQQRLARLTASQTSTLSARRDDVDRLPRGVNFATMRSLRLTTFQVTPGREGEFLNAIRTSNPKDGQWLLYEANETSTYALITLARGPMRRRSDPIPRALRRERRVYTKVETRIYTVRRGWTKLF